MKTNVFKIIPLTIPLALVVMANRQTSRNYLFVALHPIPECDGKCNNYTVEEYQRKTAEECRKLEDSCKLKDKDKATYYTVSPTEGAIFYKYSKFVSYCDCKIIGIYKSVSVEKAREEMNKTVEEARVKNPKAYHNFEVFKTWP